MPPSRTKHFDVCILLSFAWQLLGLPSLRDKKVTGFLVLYHLGSRQCSSLIFHPIALVCTPFNSTKTLFSYDMHHNGLHDRTRKLDAIIETELSHIWLYLNISTPKMAPTLESGYISVIIKFLSPYTQMAHFGGI